MYWFCSSAGEMNRVRGIVINNQTPCICLNTCTTSARNGDKAIVTVTVIHCYKTKQKQHLPRVHELLHLLHALHIFLCETFTMVNTNTQTPWKLLSTNPSETQNISLGFTYKHSVDSSMLFRFVPNTVVRQKHIVTNLTRQLTPSIIQYYKYTVCLWRPMCPYMRKNVHITTARPQLKSF